MERKVAYTRIGGTLLLLLIAAVAGWAAASGGGPPAVVQAGPAAQPAGRPLADLLNLEGTLNLSTGYAGTLDANGWRLETGATGGPRFVPAAAGDENWDARFSPPGVTGNVSAIAISGTTIFVAGDFAYAGGGSANYIAAWNGTTWSPLGSGMDGPVKALALGADGTLYAGGQFSNAGNVRANYVAKWNGTAWSPLGVGIGLVGTGTYVGALAVSGNTLYVGGNFSTAGGQSANNVAAWDINAQSWRALAVGQDNGTNRWVNALAVSGATLYAGGRFTAAAGLPTANNIAKWDDNARSWSALATALDNGTNGEVDALAVSGGILYAGGYFGLAGGQAVNNIAKWDDNARSWSPLGSGIIGPVFALTVSASTLYAGGVFDHAGGQAANNIAAWDVNARSWSALTAAQDNGTNGQVNALAGVPSGPGSMLYAGGGFGSAGGQSSGGIATWNGSAWRALGSGMSTYVRALAGVPSGPGSTLYAGGDFFSAGGVPVNYIAAWNGSSWSPLSTAQGNGTDGQVDALAVNGSTLYAGGDFAHAGGVPALRVAKWDGTAWSALGPPANPGIDGLVFALAVAGAMTNTYSTLYAGGSFTLAGGVPANDIAKWDGSSWSPLGSGLDQPGTNAVARALAADYDGNLYVGGYFRTAGGVLVNNIAQWNPVSSTWAPLGPGLNGQVYALVVRGTTLYAGGTFTSAGGVPASYIAAWDINAQSWSALGAGTTNNVYALAVSGSTLYAGGAFTAAGGRLVNNTASWDVNARSWSGLGSGMSSDVLALAGYQTSLAAGGQFVTAGAKPSAYFGLWTPPCPGDAPSCGPPTPTPTPRPPTPAPCPPGQFSDVHPGDYFYTAVQYLVSHGVISGYADCTFRPYNNTTRGQLSKIVVGAEGWAIDTSGGPHFSDVPPSNPFYPFIETAYHHGVISGYGDGTFRWGSNVTRGQLSKIIVSAQGWTIDTSGGPHFSDVPPSNPFYGPIETAYHHNIVSGYADGTFRWGSNATRGQISKIVYSAITGP